MRIQVLSHIQRFVFGILGYLMILSLHCKDHCNVGKNHYPLREAAKKIFLRGGGKGRPLKKKILLPFKNKLFNLVCNKNSVEHKPSPW